MGFGGLVCLGEYIFRVVIFLFYVLFSMEFCVGCVFCFGGGRLGWVFSAWVIFSIFHKGDIFVLASFADAIFLFWSVVFYFGLCFGFGCFRNGVPPLQF